MLKKWVNCAIDLNKGECIEDKTKLHNVIVCLHQQYFFPPETNTRQTLMSSYVGGP